MIIKEITFIFLVCRSYNNATQPVKCFYDEQKAIDFGKKLVNEETNSEISYELYRQNMKDDEGDFEFFKTLE